VFHHTRDTIEAHLTIVFTALAVARFIQNVTGFSIRHVIRTLKPLQDVTIQVARQELTAQPKLTDHARHIVDSATH
jgi:hypothetical protein